MEEIVRILSGSYTGIDDGVRIELYGKNEEGESITLLYEDFRPYFILVEPPEDLVENFRKNDEIKDIEDIELWVNGEDKPCKKITVTYPWKVPGYRKKCKDRCRVLAADIPFIQRFIYDFDLGSTVEVKGDEEKSDEYTTDKVIHVDKFSEIEPIKPDLKILSFDIENSIENKTIYTISCVVKDGGETRSKCFHGDEKEILEKFQEYVVDEDPDVITGYNINGYDIPLLKERADEVGIDNISLGRDYTELKSYGNRSWRVNGRIVADAWWSVRTEMNMKRETLNQVSKELLGKEKDDVDPKEIDKEWKDNPQKVMKYCERDAELALEILEELEVLDKAMDMATVSKLPVDEGLNGRTSTLVDSLLIRKAKENNVGVPLNQYGGGRGKIKGGYVHDVKAGLYDMVIVLDFKSMYPSIIIENNICPTTISDKGSIEAPNGTKFLDKEKREGLLPTILNNLMKERDSVKKKMRNAEDEKTKSYYNGLQNAIKVIMNSFYGVMASSFYRFTNPKIGEAITGFARENIKTVIHKLEERGLEVVYGDSLDYNRIITIKGPDGIEEVKIGKFVEEYNHKKYETLSMNLETGKTEFMGIKNGIKHRYKPAKKGNLLEIDTTRGKTVVTPQHSVYALEKNRPKLVNAKDLNTGDFLISTNKLPTNNQYKEGDEIDLAKLNYENDENDLRAYKTDRKFPIKDEKEIYPYCGEKRKLYTHVSAQHRDRKVALKDVTEEHEYIGGKHAKAGKIPRYWELDSDLAWILGYYCADGSASDGTKQMISFGSQNLRLIKKVQNYFNNIINKHLKIIEDIDKRTDNKMYYYRIQRKPLVSLFVHGLNAGKGCEGKKVPNVILNSEEKLKRKFIEGYTASDGSRPSETGKKRYKSNFLKFTSKSKRLAIGMNYLLKTIEHGQSKNNKNISQVLWSYREDKPKISNFRTVESTKKFNPAKIRDIKEVKPTKEYVYDIEVEGNHNFLDAEGNIVVHNTDSVFFKSPYSKDIEKTIDIGKEISNECTEEPLILELEKIVDPLFSHGKKKRYVGKVIWPEDAMLIRGYETRRSDSFEAQDESLQELFDYILDKDIEGGIDRAKEWIEETREGEVEEEKLVISRTCKKFSYYKNPDSMPNVQAARKMQELGYEFTPGMKVSWVVTNAQKTPQEVEPWVPDHELEKEPDWEYYARRIAKTLARVTEVFGWDEDALLAGNKQSSLFSSQFENDDKKKEKKDKSKNEPEKTDEKLTLEDFM